MAQLFDKLQRKFVNVFLARGNPGRERGIAYSRCGRIDALYLGKNMLGIRGGGFFGCWPVVVVVQA